MLIPFQTYRFIAKPPVKELHRKFLLLLEQKNGGSGKRKMLNQGKSSGTPLFTGAMEGEQFTLCTHKANGEEDVVKIAGKIGLEDHKLTLEIRLLYTNTWLATMAGSIVIAMAAAYLYTLIGEKILDIKLTIAAMPYLILTLGAVYVNLKRFSNKATLLFEQLMYWLELEEE
jgi:hypothetical protein